jgi:hypothetical protein
LEFAFHDFLIEYISEAAGSKDVSFFVPLKNFLMGEDLQPNEQREEPKHASHHHWHNELFSSFTAGCLAAFLTNGIETVAVNK